MPLSLDLHPYPHARARRPLLRAGGAARGAAMLLHGNCMNFYTGAPRFLPPQLVKARPRGARRSTGAARHVASLNSRGVKGGAFQMTKEAIADNRHAAGFLRKRGFATPIVIGHSNGGMLAVQHVADHPDTPALVLLSAHLGGMSIVPRQQGRPARRRAHRGSQAQARQMVAEGRGKDRCCCPAGGTSSRRKATGLFARSFPTCWRWRRDDMPGALYPRRQGTAHIFPAEEFAARAGGRCEVRIVKDCDHFYGGREAMISGIVTDWLEEVMAKT